MHYCGRWCRCAYTVHITHEENMYWPGGQTCLVFGIETMSPNDESSSGWVEIIWKFSVSSECGGSQWEDSNRFRLWAQYLLLDWPIPYANHGASWCWDSFLPTFCWVILFGQILGFIFYTLPSFWLHILLLYVTYPIDSWFTQIHMEHMGIHFWVTHTHSPSLRSAVELRSWWWSQPKGYTWIYLPNRAWNMLAYASFILG